MSSPLHGRTLALDGHVMGGHGSRRPDRGCELSAAPPRGPDPRAHALARHDHTPPPPKTSRSSPRETEAPITCMADRQTRKVRKLAPALSGKFDPAYTSVGAFNSASMIRSAEKASISRTRSPSACYSTCSMTAILSLVIVVSILSSRCCDPNLFRSSAITASVTHGRALYYAGASARSLLHTNGDTIQSPVLAASFQNLPMTFKNTPSRGLSMRRKSSDTPPQA
jgi:hypothetical protein